MISSKKTWVIGVMVCCLSTILPFHSSAQLIVPKRDIQPVDSLNRTKPIAPLTVIKNGYAQISDINGNYKHQHLRGYLNDSLGISQGDFAFWLLDAGLTPVPAPTDSAVRTGYTLFQGLSGGLDTKIEMLKEGTININKQQAGADFGDYLFRFNAFDTLNDNVTFNITNQSNQSINDRDENLESAGIGWNFSPGGGRINTSRSALGLFWEYNWANPNDGGRLWDEFQIRWCDKFGNQCRPIDIALKHDDYIHNQIGIRFPLVEFSPTDTIAWWARFRWDSVGQRITQSFANPYTGSNGLELSADYGANTVNLGSVGMTDPIFYINNFYGTQVNGKLNLQSLTGDKNSLLTRDAITGWINEITYTDLADSLVDHDILNWTDGGGYLFPTLNQSVFIPSYQAGMNGILNVKGRIDQHFPGTTLSNIAIGNGSGNTSLTGDDNVYIGRQTGEDNLSGSRNVFIGPDAGTNFTGDEAVAIGYQALGQSVSATNVAAVGLGALRLSTGNNNSAFGALSGYNVSTGASNTLIGMGSIYSLTTGNYNTALGYSAGNNTQTGSANTFLGMYAGLGNGHSNNASSNNVIIGTEAGFNLGGDGNIFIGRSAGANESGSNKLYIDNSDSATPLILGDLGNDSLHVYGKLAYETNGGAPSKIAGRSGTQFSDISPGTGLTLVDAVLSLDPSSPDSLYGSGPDTLCFVITGVTHCEPLDSIIIVDGEICYFDDGDTTCTGMVTGVVRISDLLGADKANVIDNQNYKQEWRWQTLNNNSGLKLSAQTNGTALLRLLQVELLGSGSAVAHGVSSNVIRTGGSQNVGVYGNASSGAVNYGVLGSTTSSSNSYGVYGSATSGTGMLAHAETGGLPFRADYITSSTNTAVNVADLRWGTDGTPAANLGGYLTFTGMTTGPNYAEANRITSKWTDATYATRTSQLTFNGVNSGTSNDILTVSGAGQLTLNQYTTSNFNGGAAADSVLVCTSGGVVKKRNTSSFNTTSIPINGIAAATGTNTKDHTDYAQEWQWSTLSSNTGLKLSSTSTAAASNTQKLFAISLSGANATSTQTTYSAYFSNTHSGTSSTNYGLYSEAGTGTTNVGIYGKCLGGAAPSAGVVGDCNAQVGVLGITAGGVGIKGTATTGGTALRGETIAGLAGHLIDASTVTNTSINMLRLERQVGSGVGANGVGSSIDYYAEVSNGTSQFANSIKSTWSDATNGSRTSQMVISGVNSTTTGDIISFEGDKRVVHYGRNELAQGADVASTGTLALGYDGNQFEITGTTTINLMSSVGWTLGSVVTLMFSSSLTLTDGTANSGTDIGFELDGNGNFGATADDLIEVKLSEIGGVTRWREQSRSAN